jgi:hypothetical protein
MERASPPHAGDAVNLEYAQAKGRAGYVDRPWLIPRSFVAAACLLVAGVSCFLAGLVFGLGKGPFAGLHVTATALVAASHLFARWPETEIEPVRVALVRWMSQGSLRVLALLALTYVIDGPIIAAALAFGAMLAHDLTLLAVRIREGRHL